MKTLFDYGEAMKSRDASLTKVRKNGGTWVDEALDFLQERDLLRDDFTGEDLKNRLLLAGMQGPHHNNAWGSLTLTALKRQIIVPTGEYRAMRNKKSNARKTPVYRRYTEAQ